jgi:hypothetical protein
MLVEGYATAAARDAALNRYVGGKLFAAGELIACGYTDHLGGAAVGICITHQGIQAHFKDNKTIVHVAACCSVGFAGDFTAREFFGYDALTTDAVILRDANRLWGRMHGEIDVGAKRAARVAYDGGAGYNASFKLIRTAALDTVLSPAVKSHVPEKDGSIPVGQEVEGMVVFDAKMTFAAPERMIDARGCDAKLSDRRSDGEFTLRFKIKAEKQGDVTLTVDPKTAEAIRAGPKKQGLDGNTDPPGLDHVGPNEDRYEWKVRCGT